MKKHLEELINIDPQKDFNYKDYLTENCINIIVHPGYAAFIDENVLIPELKDTKQSIVKQIINNDLEESLEDVEYIKSGLLKIMLEKEVDLFNYLCNEQKLTLIIAPRNYKVMRKKDDLIIPLFDHYNTYLEEITEFAENFVIIESEKYNSGNIDITEYERIKKFFEKLNVQSYLISGGYLGRCLNETIKSLSKITSTNNYKSVLLANSCSFSLNELPSDFLLKYKNKINSKIEFENFYEKIIHRHLKFSSLKNRNFIEFRFL